MKESNKTGRRRLNRSRTIVEFKSSLKKLFDRKTQNLIMVKIRNQKFEGLSKYSTFEWLGVTTDEFWKPKDETARLIQKRKFRFVKLYLSLKETSRKYRLRARRDARIEFLGTPKYLKKLLALRGYGENFMKDIVNGMTSRQIKIYEKYYEQFVDAFAEVDRQDTRCTISQVFGHSMMGRIWR